MAAVDINHPFNANISRDFTRQSPDEQGLLAVARHYVVFAANREYIQIGIRDPAKYGGCQDSLRIGVEDFEGAIHKKKSGPRRDNASNWGRAELKSTLDIDFHGFKEVNHSLKILVIGELFAGERLRREDDRVEFPLGGLLFCEFFGGRWRGRRRRLVNEGAESLSQVPFNRWRGAV